METPSRGRRVGDAEPQRRGASALGTLPWIVGLLLFVPPFLRPAAAPNPPAPDDLRLEVGDLPFQDDLRAVAEELELDFDLAEFVRSSSEESFGLESEPFLQRDLVEAWRIAPGRKIYARECTGCHGENGDGGGPAARYLDPRPRNFRRGVFKFTSTASGHKPLRTDLFRTITRGLSGASMPTFRLLPEERRWDVVEYVRYLTMRGEFEQLLLDEVYDTEERPDPAELAEIVYERWSQERLRSIYPDSLETEADQASIERGRAIFLDPGLTNCSTCHGTEGKGDGITADKYTDDWGYRIVPRNFQRGVFRSGDTPEDLWRSIATGINGTPMGAFGENLTGEQIWDLVHFVQSLAAGGTQ